jgi:Uncharacterized protein conserved in bacteria (DUF2252)
LGGFLCGLGRQHGERVVQGQRMMQAASDIYLGWTKGLDVNRHFYWRQLRDMKGSALVGRWRWRARDRPRHQHPGLTGRRSVWDPCVSAFT